MNATPRIPETMQAVRLHGTGFESLRVETVPVPVPNDDQILVRVDAAGVCSSILKLVAQGSDHTFINGWDLRQFPVILGDEGCVTVVRAGRNVARAYPLGQRFATQPAVDHPPVGHRERYRNQGRDMAKVAVGYSLPGHLAEYMLVTEETLRARCLLPLPSADIPAFAGALCEPLSCVISAQDRHLHISQATPVAARVPKLGLLPGGVVLIVGAGPMGRLHAEAALRYAPAHLIVSDLSSDRLAWINTQLAAAAAHAGTTLHAVTSAQQAACLEQASAGRGADDIIVAVGNRAVQTQAQQWLARGGVLNLFGGLKRGEHLIDLDTLRVHYDEIRLCGSSGGSPADVAEALRITAAGIFKPGNHLAAVGSLDCFPHALELVRDLEADGKIVLYPQIRPTSLTPAAGWEQSDERCFLQARARSAQG